jgi:predicted ArsR family transcriptional regulator
MPREHGEGGEFVETVSLDEVLETFEHVRGPVVLSVDVADRFECSRETARRKLEELYDRGDVCRRKVAGRVIYWRQEDGLSQQ